MIFFNLAELARSLSEFGYYLFCEKLYGLRIHYVGEENRVFGYSLSNNCSVSVQVTVWELVRPEDIVESPSEANVLTAVIDPPSRQWVNRRPRPPHRRHV